MSIMKTAPVITDSLLKTAPAIFADTRYAGTSEKFQFISTVDLIEAMRREGFVPVRAKQTRPRLEDRYAYARHVIVFRSEEMIDVKRGDIFPEIVLFNAHDGTSSYRLHAGIFRLICENGLVVADATMSSIRIPHSRVSADHVVESTHRIAEAIPRVLDHIDTWKGTWLSDSQQLEFAHAALAFRFGDTAPVTANQVLGVRRREDMAQDLFTTMNVVQENLIRGGLEYFSKNGRRMRTRRLAAIDAATRVNIKLWDLASSFSYSLN